MRRTLVGTATFAMLVLPHRDALAKDGGSLLGTDRPAYAVGEVAVARAGFVGTPDTLAEGPYLAYMVPGYRSFEIPRPIPDYAVPIGPMTITEGYWFRWVARLEFTVPQVPSGRYSIQYCNVPCTLDAIADLSGGSFFVGQTVKEARLAARVERLRWKVDMLGRRARQAGKLRQDLRATEGARDELLAANRRLHAQLSDLESASERAAPRPPQGVPLAWTVAIIALAATVAAVLLRRRRRPAVPDTVPAELVEEAQVPARQPVTCEGSPGIVSASPGMSSSGSSPVTKS